MIRQLTNGQFSLPCAMDPLRRDLLLDGLRHGVHVFDGGAPALLALHGFTGTGRDFEPLVHQLERQIAAPDLVGHGRTAAPDDVDAYRMPAVVRRLELALNELKLGRVPVLGYSMGGRAALHLALAAPERVEALVLVGTTPGFRDAAERSARVRSDEALADRIERDGVDEFADDWERHPIIASQSRIEPRWRDPMRARRRDHTATGLANSLRGMGTGAMTPVWDRLAELHVPTLLITGVEDEKFGAIASDMLGLLPRGAHVAVRGAGHCAHLERPDEVAAQIWGFLKEVDLR